VSATRQPFVLPEFYIGWPARLNPHLGSARSHTKAWAREVGILDPPAGDETPEIWTSAQFDAMDYGLLCAYTHPDAPAVELDLITDWYVWVFYLDDHFLDVYKRPGDADRGRAYLERLSLFMPLDLDDPAPEPINPVERSLYDVWRRTVPTKTPDWRRRLRLATKQMLDGFAWELANIDAARVANPIEYVEMRRDAGGTPWVATLVEHASFIELPGRVVDSRPVRVLTDCLGDGACLRNDVFSYDREVHEEGELANCMLVLERFFDLSTQDAADMTSEIANSRQHQLENTASTEVPAMFEEEGLAAAERHAVALYVKGLQDWQAGCHEWHLRSGRYTSDGEQALAPTGPTGLGTSAARVKLTPTTTGLTRIRRHTHIPHDRVSPPQLPAFYMPFAVHVNRHEAEVTRTCAGWCRAMGMLATPPGLPNAGIWTEQLLEELAIVEAASRIFPDADLPTLDLAAHWLAWGTYVDDYFPRVYGTARNMAGAKIFTARLALFLPLDACSLPPPTNPVERGLADLWPRTAGALTTEQRAGFRDVLTKTFDSWLWELQNLIQHRVPDPVDYIEMRRRRLRFELTLSVGRPADAAALPPQLLQSPPLLALQRAAQDYCGLINDIVSYYKEIRFEGELNNGVLVIQNFLGISPQEAVRVAADLMCARVKQFQHVLARELPILADELGLDDDGRGALDARALSLMHWMAAEEYWSTTSGRYDPELVRRRYDPDAAGDARLSGAEAARAARARPRR